MTRDEKFQLLNRRIREATVRYQEASRRGDGRTMRDLFREIRKSRGRIAALPRAGDDRPSGWSAVLKGRS